MSLALVRCFNCEHEPELCCETYHEPWCWQVHCMVCGAAGPVAAIPEAATIAWNTAELHKLKGAADGR